MLHPAAHATQPLWKSRDRGALQRSDAAALPRQRVTSRLGAQELAAPGPTGACVPQGGMRHVCGCTAWAWVSLCTQQGLTPGPGWARGYGVLTWSGSPQHPQPALLSPRAVPLPPAPAQGRRQGRVTLGVLLLSCVQMELRDKGLSPVLTHSHLWCQRSDSPIPFTARGSAATLCPQGHPEHPPVALRNPVG